jgi:hypothetical protein
MILTQPDPTSKDVEDKKPLNKYESINKYWTEHQEWPFFEKIYAENEASLIKEVNYMMQKGWVPQSEIKYDTEALSEKWSIYMMRSPMLSLPSIPNKK